MAKDDDTAKKIGAGAFKQSPNPIEAFKSYFSNSGAAPKVDPRAAAKTAAKTKTKKKKTDKDTD